MALYGEGLCNSRSIPSSKDIPRSTHRHQEQACWCFKCSSFSFLNSNRQSQPLDQTTCQRLFLPVRTFWATLEKTHMRTLAYQNCINFIHSLISILMTVKVNYLFAIIPLYTLVQEHVIAVQTSFFFFSFQ